MTTETIAIPRALPSNNTPSETMDTKPLFVVDKRDGMDCQVVRFYPKCQRLLVWKKIQRDFGLSGGSEACMGLHVKDVDGGEKTLKDIGVWEKINPDTQKEIVGEVEAIKQARVEAIKKAHETRKRNKRECMSPLQLLDEQVRIRLKAAMDERFPNRGKGRGTVEMRKYKEESLKRITREVEIEINIKS